MPQVVLTAFVPRLTIELAASGVPSWTSVDGSMLSADISGFTALSERLAGKGKAGAEEITGLINAAYQYTGEILKFGGDALLIIFRGPNHERRAADAGTLMQRVLSSTAAAKRAQLSMTVGINEGPFDAFLVGSGYQELLITGRRATEVIRLEGAASRGETLVSPSIARLLPLAMQGREDAGGVIVTGSTGDAPTGAHSRPLVEEDLTPFVPRQVAEQLAAFDGVGGEHRLVTVGFVMVAGVDAALDRSGPAAVAAALSHVVDHVVESCSRVGVTVLHTDIAHDGIKFVLCAGAPVSTGDSADAMLQAALAIATIESPFVIRQGIQTGRVFAGFLGSPHRRTYTLMGDPVNTAARMLGKAGDREIVAVAGVVQSSRTVFVSEELEPFMVKGKSEPILAHKVRAATGRVRRDMAGAQLYGRTYELEVLVRAVGELGQVVELVGTAGVGKSRLLDAAWDAAEGLSAYHGACTPYGAATPYSVFRPLLRSGTGISEDAAPDQAGSRLSEFTEQRAPHLLPMLPLLAVPFGARVPSTSEADAIDPAFRQARLHDVVVEFLDAVLDGPALLVVEDAHWIDTASGELVNHVIGACADRAWAIIVTRRPEGQWRGPEGLDHVRSLSLAPLDDAAIRQLAIDVSRHPLTDADLDIVSTRAQGNPLFAIELARALGESMTELPDTVEQIIASRLDHLAPEARRLVRVASVLGNQFDASIVGSIIEAEGYSGDVDEALAAASAAGAMALRSGTTWGFNHALYRDTAYEGLPFTRRRHLHRLAAEIIEQRASDTTSVAPLLSLHYAAARAHDQAWRYSLLAGAAAIAQHASSEAAAAFERALTAGRYCRQVGADDRARVAGQLGDLYYEIGRFDDATRVLTFARRVNTDPVTEVGLIRRIGSVCERQGRPDRAIQWYARAARGVPATAHDAAWSLARAEVTLAEAGIRSRRGEQAACLRLARAALTDAERSANEPVRALALERIHLATAYLRIPDTDRAGRRAVEAYRALDNSTGMARVLINLGIEAYFASDWSTASEHYLSALELAQRTGSVVLAATAAINSAEILSDQGDWARATELLDSARRNYSAVGYSAGIAAASLFAAVAAMRDGRLDEARSRLDVARDLLGRLGMAEMVDELDGRELELDALMGTATIERCRTLETRFGLDHPSTARVKRTRGILEHLAGRDDDATATLLDAVALDATPGLERALTLRALEQVAPIAPEADRWHDEADAILSTLGVRRVPPLPSRP